ncbi:MAG: HvfC/BufC family peptide modification chaperone [Thiotrichales bacterium]
MPPSLHEALRALNLALVTGETDAEGYLRDKGELSGEERINIYRSSFQGIQVDAMAAIYPVVQALTGEAFFRAMAKKYLQQYPSRSGDLHQIGEQFPAFIKTFPPAVSLPYLADTGTLEWAWHRCFHAADRQNFDFAAFSACAAQPEVIFHLSPDVHFLQSDFPVHRIWEANQAENNREIDLDAEPGPHYLLIDRTDYRVSITSINGEQFNFLQSVGAGQPLKMLGQSHDIATQLPRAIERGWIDQFTARLGNPAVK